MVLLILLSNSITNVSVVWKPTCLIQLRTSSSLCPKLHLPSILVPWSGCVEMLEKNMRDKKWILTALGIVKDFVGLML